MGLHKLLLLAHLQLSQLLHCAQRRCRCDEMILDRIGAVRGVGAENGSGGGGSEYVGRKFQELGEMNGARSTEQMPFATPPEPLDH